MIEALISNKDDIEAIQDAIGMDDSFGKDSCPFVGLGSRPPAGLVGGGLLVGLSEQPHVTPYPS